MSADKSDIPSSVRLGDASYIYQGDIAPEDLQAWPEVVVVDALLSDEIKALATEAVITAHDDELRAYLNGEVEANAWRPDKYATAVLESARNALTGGEDG